MNLWKMEKKTVKLGKKGCEGIVKASESQQIVSTVVVGQLVHVKCRKEFISPNVIARDMKRNDCKSDQAQNHCPLYYAPPHQTLYIKITSYFV